MRPQRTYWIHWANAMKHANRRALETGVRHQVRPVDNFLGYLNWVVSEI